LSYGHLPLAGIAAALFALVRRQRYLRVVAAALLLWAVAGFAVARFVIDINGRGSMPTPNFLKLGAGRVLDIGAGTGRSSIMLLEARPQATLVALDLFGESYQRHFGDGLRPEERLMANLRAAGVEQRATIQPGDMRKLPFEASSFDAALSAYAVDHLSREGIRQALAEAARVVKPGGDFLLMLVGKEPWAQFTFGPLLAHSGARGASWWSERMAEAGFEVVEQGTKPATLWLLGRRR
jgi:SAM-dependent methyltransferase